MYLGGLCGTALAQAQTVRRVGPVKGEGNAVSRDLTELARVAHVLEEALALLKTEHARLAQQHSSAVHDHSAGSPLQTLTGARELSGALSEALKRVVLAAGYSALGLDRLHGHTLEMARKKPVAFPFGAERMARPLGGATVRALEMIRDLDFFDGDIGTEIDAILASPQATYPPADWDTFRQRSRASQG